MKAVFVAALIASELLWTSGAAAQSQVTTRIITQNQFALEVPEQESLPFVRGPRDELLLFSVPTNRTSLEVVDLTVSKLSVPGNTRLELDLGSSRVLQLVAGDATISIDGVERFIRLGETIPLSRAQSATIQTTDDTAVFEVTELRTSKPSADVLFQKRPSTTSNVEQDDVVVASWNIQTLTTGRPVFEDSYARTQVDFDDLRGIQERVGADVYALQEISSLAALAKVFPPAEFVLCISGQFEADINGLGADQVAGISPDCAAQPDAPLADVPKASDPKQYTAFAIRRSSGLDFVASRDVKELGVIHDVDSRATRWGLEVEVRKGDASLRLLSVHFKTGCFQGPIVASSTNMNCRTVAKVLPVIRGWIAGAVAKGTPFAILGDLNRRLDFEPAEVLPTDLWDAMEGTADTDVANDIDLWREPFRLEKKCWSDDANNMRWPIDFFILDPQARQLEVVGSFEKMGMESLAPVGQVWSKAVDGERLSDHCPIRLTLRLNQAP